MANENKNPQDAKSPVKGQFPNRDEIICKDCMFRDRTTINIGEKKIPVGVTKSFCEIYKAPPESNGKPHEVLFEEGICDFYEKEDNR